MWLREQRAASTAWRKLPGRGAAETQSQATQHQRFSPAAPAPALQKELIWGIGRWGTGYWGPPRARPVPHHWKGLWGTGRWAYFLWGRRRLRVR